MRAMAVRFDLAVLATDGRVEVVKFGKLGQSLVCGCVAILRKPFLERYFHLVPPDAAVFNGRLQGLPAADGNA
jgi:hypothetical protein